MNKSQKRKQLIHYFFTISRQQQEIQDIQNEMVSHLRFNPYIIFKTISEGSHHLTFQQLKNYLTQHLQIKDSHLLSKYFFKHFAQKTVKLDDFSRSLLPYTPNVLREAAQKIQKQMQTKHLDNLIQQLYGRLLQKQLKTIHLVCLLQRELKLQWHQLKKLIKGDLSQLGPRADVYQSCGIVNIRKWMELWAQVDQYQILNIMRWFGGQEQKHLKRIYENNALNLKCSCSQSHFSSRQGDPSLSKQSPRMAKVKSESQLPRNGKYLLSCFFRYVETIIKSQRRLNILRQGIRGYRKEIEQILHEVTSKRFPSTRLGRLIERMQTVLLLQSDVVETLMKELQHTKIDNNFIFSLFARAGKGKCQPIKKADLIAQIFEVLYTFCLSKATLKSLARELHPGLEALWKHLDQNQHGQLDATDLKLILAQSEIKFKLDDVSILMVHFGDGQRITSSSMQEVIAIQRAN